MLLLFKVEVPLAEGDAPLDMEAMVADLLSREEVLISKKGKSKNKKGKQKKVKVTKQNLRPFLMSMELLDPNDNPLRTWAPDVLDLLQGDSSRQFAVLRYNSAFADGNPRLSPRGLVQMLESATGIEGWQVAVQHRSAIRMGEVSKPQPDMLRLRNAVRHEAFMALSARYGNGSWANGVENRPLEPLR